MTGAAGSPGHNVWRPVARADSAGSSPSVRGAQTQQVWRSPNPTTDRFERVERVEWSALSPRTAPVTSADDASNRTATMRLLVALAIMLLALALLLASFVAWERPTIAQSVPSAHIGIEQQR